MNDKLPKFVFIFIETIEDKLNKITKSNYQCFYSRTNAVNTMKEAFEKEKTIWFKRNPNYSEKDFIVFNKYTADKAHISHSYLGKTIFYEIKKINIKDANK